MKKITTFIVGASVGLLLNLLYWGNMHVEAMHHIYFFMFPSIVILRMTWQGDKFAGLGGFLFALNVPEFPLLFTEYPFLPSLATVLQVPASLTFKGDKQILVASGLWALFALVNVIVLSLF